MTTEVTTNVFIVTQTLRSQLQFDRRPQLAVERWAVDHVVDEAIELPELELVIVDTELPALGPEGQESVLTVEIVSETKIVKDADIGVQVHPDEFDRIATILVGQLHQGGFHRLVLAGLQPHEAEL